MSSLTSDPRFVPVTASALDPDQPTSKLTYVVHRDAPAPAPYHLGATVHL